MLLWFLLVSNTFAIGFPRAAGYVATRLMCRLICNLPEMNIRIYLIRLLPI